VIGGDLFWRHFFLFCAEENIESILQLIADCSGRRRMVG